MDRRKFLHLSGMGVGALAIPLQGTPVSAQAVDDRLDASQKRTLADAALNTATADGASYCDCRIGRYLNQFVITREDKVQNIVNTESYGVGVRVLAEGTWGFAATSEVSKDSIRRAAKEAVAIARANAPLQERPVQLAPTVGHGEVSWQTPIRKNAMRVPISEKVDLLMAVNV